MTFEATRSRQPLAAFILLFLGLLPACCPSGAWVDNFGSLYSIVTFSSDEAGSSLQTTGVVDTRQIGCGVWTLRPPGEGEAPVDPENPIAWVVENPNPNPADACCYAFRFDGRITGSGCLLIVGEYHTVGGKCEQSGQMLLELVQ